MMETVKPFLNKEGKLKSWPAKRQAKIDVLRWLGLHFVPGRFYSEKEINAMIEEHHSFGDYFLLRRELIDRGILERTANGARYWRGRLWPQFEPFETERLRIKAADEGDFDELWAVYSACAGDPLWEEPATETSLREMLEGRDLPPNGSPEFDHIALLSERSTGRPVGLASYYCAYPQENANWLGLFLVHPDVRRQGYGREFITAYWEECRLQGYEQVGLGVLLRNPTAMKFWYEMGYRQLRSLTLDDERGPGTPGRMGLIRKLPRE